MKFFNKRKYSVGAVVVSAGQAVRMNGIDKPFIDIAGMPTIAKTLLAFEISPFIDYIVLVCREDNMAKMMEIVREFKISKITSIVVGDDTRQASVFKGISALPQDIDYVAIHDGARPFLSQQVIKTCVLDAVEYKACTAGIKAKDTIKVVNNDGYILNTPPRDSLYITQTPQIFNFDLYKKAMKLAIDKKLDFTDDCQLIENMGEKVFMSQSEYINIKLTTPEDIAIAQIIADGLEG